MVRNASSAWASLIAGLPPPEAPSRLSSLSAMAQPSLFAPQSAPCRHLCAADGFLKERLSSDLGEVRDGVHRLAQFVEQSQAVQSCFRIRIVDRHVKEEAVHRRAQRGERPHRALEILISYVLAGGRPGRSGDARSV